MSGRRTVDVAVVERPDGERTVGERFEAGAFDREARCFRMTIPAPPRAQRVEVQERPHEFGDTHVGYMVEVACPHCLKDVEFAFTQGYSETVMRQLKDLRAEVEQLRLENRMLHAIACGQRDRLKELEPCG